LTHKKELFGNYQRFCFTIYFQTAKMRQYVSPASIMANDEVIYYLMNEDDVLNEIKKTVKEVNDILGLSSTTIVRLLLNYFHWDKDTLTGKKKFLN